MNIQPIVEGHGEVSSLPILLRRLRDKAQAWKWRSRNRIGTRDRNPQSGILCRTRSTAAQTHDCASILVLSDADNDCPMKLTPNLDLWARTEANPVPCLTVMAPRRMIGFSRLLADRSAIR